MQQGLQIGGVLHSSVPLTVENLRTLFATQTESLPNDLALRTHRAISWIERACLSPDDEDAEFMFFWVAFNALYAKHNTEWTFTGERNAFAEYFDIVTELDTENLIYDVIWKRFPESIRILLDNKFVYQPFWNHYNKIRGYENWEESFERSKEMTRRALGRVDTPLILSTLFDRLYVLRNQLFHGAATWKGTVNRPQVQDGARIMSFLLPIFVKLMLDNPQTDWGVPVYPVVGNR